MSVVGFQLFSGIEDAARQVLDLRQQQHALIAGNLANATTPGFRARELDFDGLLQRVVAEAEAGDRQALEQATLIEHEAPPWALDGNSVNAEREASKLLENKVVYEALVVGVNHHLSMLRFAASDGRK